MNNSVDFLDQLVTVKMDRPMGSTHQNMDLYIQ